MKKNFIFDTIFYSITTDFKGFLDPSGQSKSGSEIFQIQILPKSGLEPVIFFYIISIRYHSQKVLTEFVKEKFLYRFKVAGFSFSN